MLENGEVRYRGWEHAVENRPKDRGSEADPQLDTDDTDDTEEQALVQRHERDATRSDAEREHRPVE